MAKMSINGPQSCVDENKDAEEIGLAFECLLWPKVTDKEHKAIYEIWLKHTLGYYICWIHKNCTNVDISMNALKLKYWFKKIVKFHLAKNRNYKYVKCPTHGLLNKLNLS